MLNEREMKYRLGYVQSKKIPITNYGTLIAYINGILPRTIAPFSDVAAILEQNEKLWCDKKNVLAYTECLDIWNVTIFIVAYEGSDKVHNLLAKTLFIQGIDK